MEIYFVRHGETDWNREKRIQGQVDIPLNEFGISLAEKTGIGMADVAFDACISSDSIRAYETAKIILKGRDITIETDERLREMAFGEDEGKFFLGENKNISDEFDLFFTDPVAYRAAPGGENFDDVKERVALFLEDLEKREDLRDSTVLIATHGATLCGIVNVLKNLPTKKYWGKGVHKNCAVTHVEYKDDAWHILSENVVYYDDEVPSWGDNLYK